MTNYFTNFFGKSKSSQTTNPLKPLDTMTDSNFNPTSLLTENMFVAHNPPAPFTEKEKGSKAIKQLLKADYFAIGYKDGVEYHSATVMKYKVDALASQFRFLLDEEIAAINNEVNVIEQKLVQVGEMYPEISGQLRVKASEHLKKADECREQKNLSVELEGWISQVISQYKLGYECGLSGYLEGENLFGSFRII